MRGTPPRGLAHVLVVNTEVGGAIVELYRLQAVRFSPLLVRSGAGETAYPNVLVNLVGAKGVYTHFLLAIAVVRATSRFSRRPITILAP